MKNPKKDLSLVSQVHWGRLAAYIDGEGCVHTGMTKHKDPDYQGRKGSEYIKVFIANTNLMLVLWLQETLAERSRSSPSRVSGGKKPMSGRSPACRRQRFSVAVCR